MMIRVARHTLRVCMTLVGVVLILVAVFTVVARLGLPFVAGYKQEIEARVSDYLKSPVVVGELSLSWEGLGPRLRAQDVAVLDSDQRKVSLDELLIDLNLARSLLRGVAVIDELTLVGASLAVEADAEGQLHLHGMESVRGTAFESKDDTAYRKGVNVLAWLLNTNKVSLLDTQLTFIDVRAGRTLVVEDLNVRAENSGNLHRLRVELELPDALGGRLEAGIDLTGGAETLATSDGDLYLRAERLEVKTFSELLNLGRLLAFEQNSLAHIDAGVSVELWGRWENGRLVSAHGPVSSGEVLDTNTGDTLLRGFSAVLELASNGRERILTADKVRLTGPSDDTTIDSLTLAWSETAAIDGTTDTSADEPDSVSVSASSPSSPPASSGARGDWRVDARGTRLSISTASSLHASMLRLAHPRLAEALYDAKAGGWLHDWALSLGAQAGRPILSLQGSLDQLALSPVAGLPGAGPLNGRIDIVDLQGEVSLSADDMPLPWPAYTDRSLQLDTLKSVVTVDARDLQRIQLGADLALADGGIEMTTRLKATLVPGQSPHLDAQSSYALADLSEIKDWLPRRRMGPGLTRWLDRAVEGGVARNGSLLFFGRLSDFPFDEGEGVFRSSVDIEQGRLAYLSNWPVASDIEGKLELNGLMLTGHAEQASLDQFGITQTHVRIDDLLRPVLQLKGTGQGQVQQIINFANTGPLSSFLLPVLGDITGSGEAAMDLQLSYQMFRDNQPDGTPLPFSVDGAVFLKDNTIGLARAQINLTRVTGAIGFDENGICINDLRAHALGQPIIVDARTEGRARKATTYVSVAGALYGSEVLAHYGIPLDQFVRGASTWTIELSAPHSAARMSSEGLVLQARSDLVGTELMLPSPLRKGTSAATDFTLETAFRTGQSAQRWLVRHDHALHASAWVEEGSLDSLQLQIGPDSLPEALLDSREPGIRLQGEAGMVAIDGWVESIAGLIQSLPAADGEPVPILPVSAQLGIGNLQVGSSTFGPATLQMNSDDSYLNTVLQNQAFSGSVRFPREHWERNSVMRVRVSRLDSSLIAALASRTQMSPGSGADEEFSGELDPRRLPFVDLRISELTHEAHTLRDVALRAEPDVSGLTITTLGFAYQTMQLVGQGYWRLRDPQAVNPALTNQHMSRLNLVLQGDDFGEGLRYMGINDVISDGEGTLEAQLSWPGPLYLPRVADLDGNVRVLLERGSIIPLEPGAGRMVGLFALQALPRRLELDFKDMTGDGLAFQRIRGDIVIENGIADVGLIQLTGPVGVLDISGQSDLNRREFDQRITVLPRVSAALPVIGVISGGASAGIGALLATGLLKAIGIDLDRLGLRQYRLTGKWDEPSLKPVETDFRSRE